MLILGQKSNYIYLTHKKNSITKLTPVRNRHVVTTRNFMYMCVAMCQIMQHFCIAKLITFFLPSAAENNNNFLINWLSALFIFLMKSMYKVDKPVQPLNPFFCYVWGQKVQAFLKLAKSSMPVDLSSILCKRQATWI